MSLVKAQLVEDWYEKHIVVCLPTMSGSITLISSWMWWLVLFMNEQKNNVSVNKSSFIDLYDIHVVDSCILGP